MTLQQMHKTEIYITSGTSMSYTAIYYYLSYCRRTPSQRYCLYNIEGTFRKYVARRPSLSFFRSCMLETMLNSVGVVWKLSAFALFSTVLVKHRELQMKHMLHINSHFVTLRDLLKFAL